ncbi:DUF305 domain-containing protein [Streptomyces sp. NPDC050625]|uniref:DUF305 domain-containing protein n=1 Tax=Streptomyces sp. NPDC050625 TaxID=3154629 RepID=UPI003418D0BF
MTTRTLARRFALVAVTATAAFVLVACGGDGGHSGDGAAHNTGHGASASPGGQAGAGAHNAQDVSFAQGMIPHHQQALEMARLASSRASSAQVKELAAGIEKAQDPEISTMTGWLKAWGEEVPMAGMQMDHSGHSGMAGMMSTEDMAALKKATGKDFDTMFLTMMVDHHKGAVEMATAEKTKGEYGPATGMANDIVTAQNAEIKEMNRLLGKS